MATLTSIGELRNMQVSDLKTELASQSTLVAKLRMGVKMNKDKDSAKYKREKKQLARMCMVLTEKTEKTQEKQVTTKVEKSAKSSVPKTASKVSSSSQS